jgi:hypothetical protein
MIEKKTGNLLIASSLAAIGVLMVIRFDAFGGLVAWVQRYDEWRVVGLFLPVFLAVLLLVYYRRGREELRRQKSLYEDMLKIQSELAGHGQEEEITPCKRRSGAFQDHRTRALRLAPGCLRALP